MKMHFHYKSLVLVCFLTSMMTFVIPTQDFRIAPSPSHPFTASLSSVSRENMYNKKYNSFIVRIDRGHFRQVIIHIGPQRGQFVKYLDKG